MLKKIFNLKNISIFIFISFALSSAFIILMIILSPGIENNGNISQRVKSDYVLMLIQCIVGMAAMMLPGFFTKKINIQIPSKMLLLYTVFLYCAIYLGEVRSFYYSIPYWDTILHTFSGAMIGAFGYSFISLLNNTDSIPINLSPIFVALFTLCFAITLGVIWEFYEFTIDSLFKTNMQKYMLEDGEMLMGQAALADTMKDLIVDFIGAFIVSAIGYISLKYKKGWIDKVLFKRHNIKIN